MEIPAQEIPGIDIIEEEDISIGLKSKVILYNDDWHSFDEVIMQIIKAIGVLTPTRARRHWKPMLKVNPLSLMVSSKNACVYRLFWKR